MSLSQSAVKKHHEKVFQVAWLLMATFIFTEGSFSEHSQAKLKLSCSLLKYVLLLMQHWLTVMFYLREHFRNVLMWRNEHGGSWIDNSDWILWTRITFNTAAFADSELNLLMDAITAVGTVLVHQCRFCQNYFTSDVSPVPLSLVN